MNILKAIFRKKSPYNMKFNEDRYSEWVKCSIGWLGQDNGILATRIQGLGIIDAELYDINKYDTNQLLEHNLLVYDHINIKSYLWVLGVYELFRMLDQRIRESKMEADEDMKKAINDTKNILLRIRVPLAKLEPSNKYKNKDYPIPALGASELQLGWSLNDHEVIWYRDLSNEVINCLNTIRTFRISENLK